MTTERRDYDQAFNRLFQKIDEHSDRLEKHAELIRDNRECMTAIQASQERMELNQNTLTNEVRDHVEEEHETMNIVMNFLRDLKGFDVILKYIGFVIKWFVIIATLGGSLTWIWSHLQHIGKGH